MPDYAHDPATPLLQLAENDAWRLGDAFEGTLILGGTGSGKTSGSGRAIAHSLLRAGAGGLVLCAKPEECALWQRYARETGRDGALIIVSPQTGQRFNFLNYELYREGGHHTFNVVALFMRILDATRHNRGLSGGGGSDGRFWEDSVKELLSHVIDALFAAYGRVDLLTLMRFVNTVQASEAQLNDAAWRAQSFAFQTLKKALEDPINRLSADDFAVISDYFRYGFGALDPKTRSNIKATLSSLIAPFMKGALRELFCTDTTFVPELSHEGAILVIDLPVKEWEQAGILGQHIIKYAWQRAAERRSQTPENRPLFLWADECQFAVSGYDTEFQSTARSSRVCTVYLTQSIAGLYHAVGGQHPKHAVDSLLANFQTKILHQNSDPDSNQWAAEIIGKQHQYRANDSIAEGVQEGNSEQFSSGTQWSSSLQGSSGGGSHSWSVGRSRSVNRNRSQGRSEVIDYALQASEFTTLQKGGPDHHFQVEAIVFQGGRRWRYNGQSWLKVRFAQR